MASWRPLKRRAFIRKPRVLSFDDPYSRTRHHFMIASQHRQSIPTNAECSVPRLRMLLEQVASNLKRPVSLEEWNSL